MALSKYYNKEDETMLKQRFEEHLESYYALIDGEFVEVIITFKEDYFEATMRLKDFGVWFDVFGAPRYQNQEYKNHDDVVQWVYDYIYINEMVDYYKRQIEILEAE